YGSVDHMLRLKLLRDSIALEVDAHSPDPKHPLRQKIREADPVSKVYRTNEFFTPEKAELSTNAWRAVKLIFKGDTVDLSVEGVWSRRLTRKNFDATKRKLLWMQNGGEAGIEIDDVIVIPTP
ncbi:MAG: hypothetical protein NTY53_06915, partial [Kiritimatiellaeota bacterium]|nr:hypothetical protein [Kiritimatiellota bacterium]